MADLYILTTVLFGRWTAKLVCREYVLPIMSHLAEQQAQGLAVLQDRVRNL